MRVIPAIDLRQGKCVRLYQGDFGRATSYADDPLEIATRFAALAVEELHVVDLDGALTGTQRNTGVIRCIAAATPFAIQLGGGIRNAGVIEHWFDAGVARCVIGSLAVQSPDMVCDWIARYGAERIVLALDVQIAADGTPLLATRGWTETSNVSLWDCLDRYSARGARHVLCTDIRRDGALSGPNVALYEDIVARYPSLALQASGGVRDAADLEALASGGIPAAITGRALLDGRISFTEVASFRQNA